MECPLCASMASFYVTVDQVQFFDCRSCDFIFADTAFLAAVDAGTAPRKYSQSYWQTEDISARERSFGPSLARFAEGVIYTRIPIKKCIDIGTGPGYLLEALQYHLPSSSQKFFGVEMFPGEHTAQSRLVHPQNYVIGSLKQLSDKFEFGT